MMEIEIHPVQTHKNDTSSGTTIVLSDFKPGVYEDISLPKLKDEIERHFEPVLRRRGIQIILSDINGTPIECAAFEYERYCQNAYRKTITTLYRTNSKKYRTLKEYDISRNPVEIYLIVSKDRELNREPVLMSKGRRVNEVWKLEQFRTNNKSSIWNRSDVGGYVDATGVLVPTPTRKDFKNTELSKAFFYTLNMYEKEIREYINKESSVTVSEKFLSFEEKVNPILQRFIQNELSGSKDEDLNTVKEYKLLGYRIYETRPQIQNGGKTDKAPGVASVKATSGRNRRERNHPFTVQLPSQSSSGSFVTLKIDNLNEPVKDVWGNPLRSVKRDSRIIVFQRHSEFQKRLSPSSNGHFEINDKIIHYLALEIICQIKNSENTGNELVYQDFVTSVLKLENELKTLVGERI